MSPEGKQRAHGAEGRGPGKGVGEEGLYSRPAVARFDSKKILLECWVSDSKGTQELE